jgi:hypothetical protein
MKMLAPPVDAASGLSFQDFLSCRCFRNQPPLVVYKYVGKYLLKADNDNKDT